jgi:hypothetical protein
LRIDHTSVPPSAITRRQNACTQSYILSPLPDTTGSAVTWNKWVPVQPTSGFITVLTQVSDTIGKTHKPTTIGSSSRRG